MLLSGGDDIVCQESFIGHFYKRRIGINVALWFERFYFIPSMFFDIPNIPVLYFYLLLNPLRDPVNEKRLNAFVHAIILDKSCRIHVLRRFWINL